jgi:hypothetical protein
MPRLRTLEEVIRLTERARIRYVTNASIDPPGLSTQLFLGCINARIQHRRLEVDLASYMPDRAQPQTFNGVDWDVRLSPEHGALLDRVIADNDIG